MIVLDESLDVEVKKIIEENHETVEKLSEIKLPVPSCLFNIFFVNKENIGTVQKLIHNQKNAYLFIFWDGGSLSGLDENELEFFTFINRSLSIDLIKKQLNIFMKENIILEKLQFSLNGRYKAELEERASYLKSIELKLSDVHKSIVPLRKVIAPNMKLFSKYALGSDIGGEFVDFEKSQDHIFLTMFSTNSYLLSSDLIEIVLQLRRQKIFKFDSFKEKIIEFSQQRNENFDYMLAKINFKNLSVETFSSGYRTIHNSDLCDSASGENSHLNIKSCDKVLFLSPGLFRYISEAKINFKNIYKNNIEDSFNEVFSQVRKSMMSGLGGPDATMALLEVQKNAFKTL